MNRSVLIAPSLLSCDFSKVADEIRSVEIGAADWLHLDVMDGHFVPNLTIGPPVIRSIRKTTQLPLDTHLMIENPMDWIGPYRKAGSDWITFHVEATQEPLAVIAKIKSLGAKAGISLRPRTSVESLIPLLKDLDLILVMTVEPGFGGQSFMEDQVTKIEFLRKRFSGRISVDGGIAVETAKKCVDAGADVLVAGTSIFGQPDRTKAIRQLRESF